MVYNKRKRMFCGALRRGGYHAQYRGCLWKIFSTSARAIGGSPSLRTSIPSRAALPTIPISFSTRRTALFDYRPITPSPNSFLENVEHVLGGRNARLHRRPSHGARPFLDALRSAPAPSRSHRCLQSEDRRHAQKLRLLRGGEGGSSRRATSSRRAGTPSNSSLRPWCIGRKS